MSHLQTAQTGWPDRLRPGALRWGRTSGHYDATIAFYRDLVGLPVIDQFSSSFGEDGTIFGLPDTTVQIEIVRAHEPQDAADALDQLVLYLDDADAVTAATAALQEAGLRPDPQPHPYWAANGAVIYQDPDGRSVVFAPWVYGREPDPIDRADGTSAATASTQSLRIDWHHGDRAELRALFEQAEDSPDQLDTYLADGKILAAWDGEQLVGHLQLVDRGRDHEVELKNMAVVEQLRGTGIGRRLVETAIVASRSDGYTRMVVATAAADIGNLRFYQRCGFRFSAIEPDAFTKETGYPESIVIDGIPLRDRLWLAQDV